MALPSIIRVGRVDSQYWTILMVLSQLVYKLKTGRLGPVLFLILIFLLFACGLGLGKYFLSSNSFKPIVDNTLGQRIFSFFIFFYFY